jgi:hypothetical protein
VGPGKRNDSFSEILRDGLELLDSADCKGLPSKVEDLISGKKNPLMQ